MEESKISIWESQKGYELAEIIGRSLKKITDEAEAQTLLLERQAIAEEKLCALLEQLPLPKTLEDISG